MRHISRSIASRLSAARHRVVRTSGHRRIRVRTTRLVSAGRDTKGEGAVVALHVAAESDRFDGGEVGFVLAAEYVDKAGDVDVQEGVRVGSVGDGLAEGRIVGKAAVVGFGSVGPVGVGGCDVALGVGAEVE